MAVRGRKPKPALQVVREGNLISIPSAHLVRDDVAEFTSGDQIPADATAFMCGPLPFMQAMRGQLIARGVPAERINYEVFGPDLWAQNPDAA